MHRLQYRREYVGEDILYILMPYRFVIVWEIWTNGLYKSTLHRVVHRGSNYR
jgi:hypothetical protein